MTNPGSPSVAAAEPLSDALYRDGSVGLKSALPPEWADRMLADFEVLYAEAEQQDLSSRQGGRRGRVPRGPGEEPRRLPDALKAHLRRCSVSDQLDPVVQDYVPDFLLEEG